MRIMKKVVHSGYSLGKEKKFSVCGGEEGKVISFPVFRTGIHQG